ncbi:MAG: hypothetical protein ACOYMF_11055 [Bacteroidales bacterium]
MRQRVNNAANKNLTTLDELLDTKYGKRGAAKREKWEQDFEVFRKLVQAS